MEYLTLKVSSSSRGLIYERDFSVLDLFQSYVRLAVSNLVEQSCLKQDEPYQATLIPRFDNGVDSETAIPQAGFGNAWLTILVDETSSKEIPIRSFILQISTLAPDARAFQIYVPLSVLDSTVSNIKTALLKLEFIKEEEVIETGFYVYSGIAPRGNQEILHAFPNDYEDIKIEVVEISQDENYPVKEMPECIYEHSVPVEQTLTIFFKREGFARLNRFVAENGSHKQEIGGVLIGEVYCRAGSDQLFVEVEDFIPAEQTNADACSLRFTHQTFQTLREKKSILFAESKRIVGWYHTHPPIAINVGGREEVTTSFFSVDDTVLHSRFFGAPWQVALVMDAESDERICFCWSNGAITTSSLHVSE